MTRDEIVARCAARFLDTGHKAVTAAEWADYVNDAYREIQATDPSWPWMYASATYTHAANTQTANLATEVTPIPYRLNAVYNVTDDIWMSPLPEGSGAHLGVFPDSVGKGKPRAYRYVHNTLYVYPTPEVPTSVRLDYVAPVATLGTGTSAPAFPSQFHDILVHGALKRAYEDYDDFQRADRHFARYVQVLAEMRAALLTTRTEGYPGILDTF